MEVVRQRLTVRESPPSRRFFEERLLRFPRLAAFAIRRVEHLPPRSRLRKALLRRGVQVGLAALSRGEPERVFSVYHPTDSELVVGERFAGLAIGGTRGREARIRFQQAWNAEWGEFRFDAEQLIDLGDKCLVIGRISGSGRASGVRVDGDWAALLTVSDGWIIKEQAFFDHAEALTAAGLSE